MHLVCKHFNNKKKNLALHILVHIVFLSFNRNLTLGKMKVKGEKDDELNDKR